MNQTQFLNQNTEKINDKSHKVKLLTSEPYKSKGELIGLEGFKFNFTAKEKAIKQIEKEQQDKEAQIIYNNILNELEIERL